MAGEKLSPQSGEHKREASLLFPHNEVERKWKNRWVDDKLYKAHDDTDKPTYYVLDMYPYPSGSGLHVGHVEGYTATDIISRYKRMNGFEVLHPMGWDAFGLPTENYAISTGENPHEVTARNADTFREQCVRTGFSIDWDREIDTSKEEYYKWTQNIFLDLFENDLAYKTEAPANWCTGCKTVIANEQVQDACCERCSSPVESRNVEQWFFKITAYADRLAQDLDKVDWLESTKEGQKNWIGKKDGTEVQIDLQAGSERINLFMTQPELLYGSSFIAIAPEHPSLDALVKTERKAEVDGYTSSMTPQSEIQRKKQKSTTGVFTGSYAINPLTGEQMPIWVSDYVLMDESGGIHPGVPSEVEADRDFALAHELPIIPIFEEGSGSSGEEKRFLIGKHRGKTQESVREEVVNELGDRAKQATRYNLRDWNISRERYWGAPIPIINCDNCGDQPVPRDQLPVVLPEMDDFAPTGIPPLAKSEEFMNVPCPHCSGPAKREAKTLDTFVDSAWYFMRFADPHNGEKMGDETLLNKWLPVDYYVGGADHTTGHLLYARFITKVLHDLGRIGFDEPFTTLKHQGMILGSDGRKMSKRWGNSVNPIDISNEYGSDAMRIYEMFMGPLDQSKIWNSQSITGSRRLVDRVWQLHQKVENGDRSPDEAGRVNTLIENVTTAIEQSRFNIAVSEFMKYLNYVDKAGKINRQDYETFLKLLAPYAPFLTEELWERAGNEYSIHQSTWPKVDTQEREKSVTIPVTINGKLRGTILQQEGLGESDEEILTFLRSDEKLAKALEGVTPKRVIYRQGRVINIVI